MQEPRPPARNGNAGLGTKPPPTSRSPHKPPGPSSGPCRAGAVTGPGPGRGGAQQVSHTIQLGMGGCGLPRWPRRPTPGNQTGGPALPRALSLLSPTGPGSPTIPCAARVSRRGRHGLQQPPPQDRQAEGWWQTPLAPRSKSSEAGKPQEGTAVGLAANVHPEPCPGWPARLRWNSGSSATLWQRRALGRRQASDGGLGRRARGHTHTWTAAERSAHAGGRAGARTESETLAQLGADTDVAAAHAQRPRAGRLQTSPNGTHPNAHEEVNDGGSYTAPEWPVAGAVSGGARAPQTRLRAVPGRGGG